MYDEYGGPSESLVMDWNEHDAHVDGVAGADPGDGAQLVDAAAPAARGVCRAGWLCAVPAEPRGAYRVALAGWSRGPLRPVVHGVPVDEEDVLSGWAARLCWLADSRGAVSEPEPPRALRSMELALPSAGEHTAAHGYTYPVILRFTDADAAAALAEQLAALAAELRRAAPDPFRGCVGCVRSPIGLCEACATARGEG